MLFHDLVFIPHYFYDFILYASLASILTCMKYLKNNVSFLPPVHYQILMLLLYKMRRNFVTDNATY